jgi:hypothetical protein
MRDKAHLRIVKSCPAGGAPHAYSRLMALPDTRNTSKRMFEQQASRPQE